MDRASGRAGLYPVMSEASGDGCRWSDSWNHAAPLDAGCGLDSSRGCWSERLHVASPIGLGFLTARWPRHSQTAYLVAQGSTDELLDSLSFLAELQKSHSILSTTFHWLQRSQVPQAQGRRYNPRPPLMGGMSRAVVVKHTGWEILLVAIFGKHNGTFHSLAFFPTLSQPLSRCTDGLGWDFPVPSFLPDCCREGPQLAQLGVGPHSRGRPLHLYLSPWSWAAEAHRGQLQLRGPPGAAQEPDCQGPPASIGTRRCSCGFGL